MSWVLRFFFVFFFFFFAALLLKVYTCMYAFTHKSVSVGHYTQSPQSLVLDQRGKKRKGVFTMCVWEKKGGGGGGDQIEI